MLSSVAEHAASMSRRAAAWSIAGLVLGGLILGCERDTAPAGEAESEQLEPTAKPDQHLPTLTFASELREPYPEVAAFLDEFLNTCLVGDYAGYRRLVSRAHTPESRERFEAIYQATEAVTIESIQPIDLPRMPPPVYRVVSTVEFNPHQQVQLRETQRKVAILVFMEGGDWRMAPAPAKLQPRDQPPPATASAPTSSVPSYPWDEEGDY